MVAHYGLSVTGVKIQPCHYSPDTLCAFFNYVCKKSVRLLLRYNPFVRRFSLNCSVVKMIVVRYSMYFLFLCLFCSCASSGSFVDTKRFEVMQNQAQAGDVESQYQLGMQYTINGQYAWDRMRGYQWFIDAAEKGHADAQYMVGMGKFLGRGTLYDLEGAVQFFRMAAEQGQERAQYQLGLAYLNGTGVSKDKAWGRQWLEQASWNHHHDAQFMLGALFAKGVGGQENRGEAWRWLMKSRAGDQDRAEKALKRLNGKMSAHDEMEGTKLLEQQPVSVANGLYANPRLRYLQTMLNRLGLSAGDEDGLPGPSTEAASSSFVRKNNLPRETQPMQLIEFLRGNYQ
jgi:TPR repeat protein